MKPFVKHVFVCENRRSEDHPRLCCASKDADAIRRQLKKRVLAAGLKEEIRVNRSGCLDQCEQGAVVVVYPETVWYGHVTAEDCDEIFEQHLLKDKPVERLRIDREETTESNANDANSTR